MKRYNLIFLFFLSFPALSDHFSSRIHSIDYSSRKKDPHLIKMENGRVVFVEKNDTKWLRLFEESLQRKDKLDVEVDDNHSPSSVTPSGAQLSSLFFSTEEQTTAFIYEPTVVSTTEAATSIFQRMRRNYQDESQCYNRAHIWVWEEFKYSGLKSTKHFLFFTRRYIRNYRYKWWFHVSPSVKVSSLGDRILDRRYTSGHRSISNWVRNFVYSGKPCPVVQKFSDYYNNQGVQDCYLIPVSMYFWQPRDIERRDRTGFEKTSFVQSEVNHAYWEAF